MNYFLIDEEYLKKTVNISFQKEAAELRIAMKQVEQFYLIDLLSLPLFTLYQTHVKDKTTLTDKQAELFEKIKLYYALLVQHDLTFNLFSITNKGNEQNQNAPILADIREKRSEVMSKVDTMKTRILAYLKDNSSDFPEYYQATSGTGTDSYNSPIIFY